MKSIVLFISLTFVFQFIRIERMVAQCAHCSVTDLSANLQVGLVGYYPFCGNAKDMSGNGNDAKVYGAILASDRFGNPSNAYYFNGTWNYMAAGPINSYINNFTFSIAAWVRHTGYNTNTNCVMGCTQYIVTIGNDRENGSARLGMYQQAQNPWLAMIDPSTTNKGLLFGNTGYPIPQQNWHFVVMTYNNAILKLYVDCVLDTSLSYSSPYNFCSDSVRIGMHNISGFPYFTHGDIDDIMIYNRVLSGAEIAQICNQGVAFVSSDSTFCNEGGSCIDFFDRSSLCNPTSWEWHFPGAMPDTSTQQNPTNICYSTPGTYPVTLIVTNGNGSDSLTVSPMITFATSASAPVLTSSGDTIFCTHAASYQWYFNGSPIANATDSFYVAKIDGVYAVQITDGNGCSRLSNGYPVSVNELIDISTLNIFTNPLNGQVNISVRKNINHGEVNIFNLIGEKIYSGLFNGTRMAIGCPNLKKSGIYIAQLRDGEKQYFGKILIP